MHRVDTWTCILFHDGVTLSCFSLHAPLITNPPTLSTPPRGYTGKKLRDNIECEIFQTILDEARESYKLELVHELISNLPEDLERNVDCICLWVDKWRQEFGSH